MLFRSVAVIYFIIYYLHKKKQFPPVILELPIYLFALLWFFANAYWMALLVFIFGSFAILSKQKVLVLVNEDDILYKSFPNRTFKWAGLNNIILKDGLLTIDFKNNKIIQQPIEETNIDETAFNHFCQHQLQTTNNP